MKILLVMPFLPSPGATHAGGKFGHYLLRTLAARHEVHLVARTLPGDEAHLPVLRRLVAGLDVVAGPGAYSAPSLPLLARILASHWRLARLARTVLARERCDLCQVEFTETGVFWNVPRTTPAVLTLHDVMAKPARRRYLAAHGIGRIAAWAKWRVTLAVEGYAASKFQRLLALSDADGRWANDLYPDAAVTVLKYPAGIDFAGLPRQEVPNRILFVGALNRGPNIEAIQWFIDGCWPAIRAAVPDAGFHIVGQGLPESHRARWSADPAIRIVGRVESVEGHYKEAAVFVAPILMGGGIIVKILDGLAAGVPVVTTTRGNEGIGAEDGTSILVADDPAAFARAVVRLLQDRALREAVGAAGTQYAAEAFSAEEFVAALERTYAGLTTAARLSGPPAPVRPTD